MGSVLVKVVVPKVIEEKVENGEKVKLDMLLLKQTILMVVLLLRDFLMVLVLHAHQTHHQVLHVV